MKDVGEWNKKVLKAKGISATVRPYSRVRVLGDLKKATLWDGTVVERKDLIYVEQYGLLKCINTELHFVYEVPANHKGWGLMCTCGSIAGVVGYGAYSKLASPMSNGMIIACLRLLTTKENTGTGEHADGSHE